MHPRITSSPVLVRVVPFVVFVVLTFAQSKFGPAGAYWLYQVKTLLGAWMLWSVRPFLPELEWRFSPAAITAGVAVFGLWIGLDPIFESLGVEKPFHRLKLGSSTPWNPHAQFGDGSGLAWLFIVTRLLGSAVLVPMLEEVFFRSFLYRYLVKQEFLTVPLTTFAWMPFLVTSAVFGLEHQEWLAGILCGVIYQGLVCWRGRIGDAVAAHAITNALLGGWVVWKGAWQFW